MPSLKLGVCIGSFLAVLCLLWWAHHSGYETGYKRATDAMQVEVDKATARTKALEDNAAKISQSIGKDIEVTRNDRSTEIAAVLAVPQPVRVCKSSGSRAVPSTPNPAIPAHAPEAAGEPLVRAGDDLRRPLVLFAAKCQRDLDDAIYWQKWSAEQLKASPP